MSPRIFTLPLLLAFALLAGCGRDDPQASLEAAVQQLQDNIEAKKTSAVLDQLAGDFRALQAHDRDWACWAMAGAGLKPSGRTYDEAAAREAGGPEFARGFELMRMFLSQ